MHPDNISTTCAALASARAVSEATLLCTSPCTDLASAIAASAISCVHRVSSATGHTLGIALYATCSASCTRHCTTDMPSGNNDLCSPGDVERARDTVHHHSNAALGALDGRVAKLPGNCPVWCTDNVVSANAVPVTYCELECTESWERVCQFLPLGDDISYSQNSCNTTDTNSTAKRCLDSRP